MWFGSLSAGTLRRHRLHRRTPLPHYARHRVRSVTATGGSAHASRKADSATDRPPAYEQARDELIELVKRLEAGGLTLEQSLQLWERGEQLAAICEDWLEGARARMATALARTEENGETPAAPF
jgi:exodeoxyribonuclease VII small subunit